MLLSFLFLTGVLLNNLEFAESKATHEEEITTSHLPYIAVAHTTYNILPPVVHFRSESSLKCITREGFEGVCVKFKECNPMLFVSVRGREFIENALLRDEIVNSSTPCFPGTDESSRPPNNAQRKEEGNICCANITHTNWKKPTYPVATDVTGYRFPALGTSNEPISETEQTQFDYDLPSLYRPPLIPSSCIQSYIIQDKDSTTRPHAYPWMAVLVNHENQPFCGGSLIDNYHILTAAHCLDQIIFPRDIQKVKVYLGAHDLKIGNPNQRRVNISKVIKHRDYNRQTWLNDIALLRLETPVMFSKYLYPVCLQPTKPQSAWTHTFVAGWGKYNTSCETCPSPVLRHTSVKIISKSECEKKYLEHAGPAPVPPITMNMICAFSPGMDACDGDSGGPLFLKDDPKAGFVQVGIVSWGVECGVWPGVYTRVASYLPWIMENREDF